jgi:hypothetical protein
MSSGKNHKPSFKRIKHDDIHLCTVRQTTSKQMKKEVLILKTVL